MKKRVISLVFSLIVVVLLVNLVVASDVAYIVKRSRSVDSGFMNEFNEMGLSVEVIESKNIKGVDFSGYKFMFIGDERLKNIKYLPVEEVPSVIANRYYGKTFGLVGKRRISKLSSNSELMVRSLGGVVKVYERATFRSRGLGIPYYYLSNRYKNKNMQGVAIPNVKSKGELGAVIAYSNSGVNKCFFGITKTEYWTAEAEGLFKDCVSFVVEGVVEPPEPEPEPECFVDLGCGVPSFELLCEVDSLVNRITTPSCIEGVCENIIIEDVQYCGYGCLDGVCLVEDIPEPGCVEDYVCGADYFSDNYCGLDGNVVKEFYYFSCVNEGCVGGVSLDLVEECFFGCSWGECLLDYIYEKHDVKLIEDYDGFGNKIRIKDVDDEIISDAVPQLFCGLEYDFQFKTKNVGDFVEDVEIVLEIRNLEDILLENVKLKEGLIAGGETTTGNKNNFMISEEVVPGLYIVSVYNSIRGFIDAIPEDNFATREIEIIC